MCGIHRGSVSYKEENVCPTAFYAVSVTLLPSLYSYLLAVRVKCRADFMGRSSRNKLGVCHLVPELPGYMSGIRRVNPPQVSCGLLVTSDCLSAPSLTWITAPTFRAPWPPMSSSHCSRLNLKLPGHIVKKCSASLLYIEAEHVCVLPPSQHPANIFRSCLNCTMCDTSAVCGIRP